MRRNDHFVEFYATDEGLVHNVAGYIADGLWQNHRAVVIATAEHRSQLQEALRARGVDVATMIATGQYVAIDAAEALAGFMVGGMPHPDRFEAVVGSVVRQATAGGRTLRAFGEMVALLWKEGNARAAIALEALWNDLARVQEFALYCAYPHASVSKTQDGYSVDHICCAHTGVIHGLLPRCTA